MPWIESHSVLIRHRKLKQFARELNIKPVTALGHLHCLWHTAIEQAEDGDLSKWAIGSIADAANWEGSEKEFLSAALSSGFLDNGNLLHDWLDYAGRYLTSKYKTSNLSRLSEIWAKYGRIYGKELKRNSLPLPKDSPPTYLPTNQPNTSTDFSIWKTAILEAFMTEPKSVRDEGKVWEAFQWFSKNSTIEEMRKMVKRAFTLWQPHMVTINGVMNQWDALKRAEKPKKKTLSGEEAFRC